MSFLNSVPRAPGVRSALAVACGLVLAAPFVAQATDADDVGQVVVTASRAPQPISRVLADVSVITRDEIERRGSASAVDLIAALPGFEISRTGGPASITGVFLRGAESRHLLVLIDGVRVDTQSGAGGATWEALPASQIERIEVVRGPASAVYGSDAMAGVVQIFTRQGQGPARVEVGFGVGTLGLWSSDAQVSGKQGAWDYAVGLASERSSGFDARVNSVAGTRAADSDGHRSASGSARLGYALNERHRVQASVASQHINGEYDATAGSTTEDRSIHDLDAASLNWTAQWLPAWRSTVSAGQSIDRYETRPSSYVTRTEVQNAAWTNEVKLGDHVVRAVLEGRSDRLLNSSVSGGEGTRRDGAFGIGHEWRRDRLAIQSAIREDHDSAFGTRVTGSVAAGWDLDRTWRVRGSWGTGFRAPTLYQRFSPYGQADLLPESSRTSEVGLQYRDGSTRLSLTMFDSHVTNLIQFGAAGVCESEYGCYRNVDAAVLKGVELSGATTWAGVRLSASWNIGSPKNAETDKLLARRARQHGVLRAEKAVSDWLVGVNVKASGHRFDDAANTRPLGGYALWGIDAQTRLAPEWKLVLRADNLFDKDYQTARNYASAPRTVFVGVRWTPGL